jgi:micrococcal nuclease
VSPGELAGPCRATHVVDGDTVDVSCGRGGARVRLLNVDTPERGQRGYLDATEALEDMLDDGDVYLAFEEPGKPGSDRFDRLLAYLVDDEGRNLNEELIREGWSGFYRKYGDGRFADEFEDAQDEAEDDGVGLWAD